MGWRPATANRNNPGMNTNSGKYADRADNDSSRDSASLFLIEQWFREKTPTCWVWLPAHHYMHASLMCADHNTAKLELKINEYW
jgi:hypothetical protein